MLIKLITGTLLTSILLACSFVSWYLLFTGRFRTHYIMPARENDPVSKGKKWFLAQSIALMFAAAIVALRTWQYSHGYSDNVINNLFYAVSGFLLLRAAGEFKHMGLFKTEKKGDFAQLDTRLLTPLAYLMFLTSLFLL